MYGLNDSSSITTAQHKAFTSIGVEDGGLLFAKKNRANNFN